MRWKFYLGVAAILVALVSFFQYYNYPSFSWNQRISVEVMVDGEPVTGSSVTKVRVSYHSNWLIPSGGRNASMSGEAVAVDLGERGVLFALLRSEDRSSYAVSVAMRQYREIFFQPNGRTRGSGNLFSSPYYELARQRDERVLPRDDYPMLVTFADIDDPTSVQLVDPDDLAASFGEGVSLNRITLAITGDGVTTGIEEVLGWLERPGPSTLSGIRYPSSNSLMNILHTRHFNTE